MKYELIKDINPKYNAIEQVLTNRGIPYNEIGHYLNTTDKDINSAEMLGEECLKAAATQLLTTIKNNKRMLVVVDSDCDGYTSSALLLNYLYDLFDLMDQFPQKPGLKHDKDFGKIKIVNNKTLITKSMKMIKFLSKLYFIIRINSKLEDILIKSINKMKENRNKKNIKI